MATKTKPKKTGTDTKVSGGVSAKKPPHPNKPADAKAVPVEAAPVAVVPLTEAANLEKPLATAEAKTEIAAQVPPPVKKTLDPKTALDAGLTMAVKSYVGLKREVAEADKTRAHARGIMVRMGMELPDDGADAGDPVAVKKKASPGRPAATPSATAATPAAGGTLWELVENHLYTGGFIYPKCEDSSTIKTLAEKAGFSTAANLLSQKSKVGELAKGDRGQYALPKGYKRN